MHPAPGQRPVRVCHEFVCALEDVLEVYHRDYGEQEVLVCLDETSKQMVGETHQPQPTIPGHPMAYDYEYRRNGVSNLFMLYAPLEGWRRVEVTERHTRKGWAGLGRGGAEAGGRRLSPQGTDRAGDGQLEHPPSVIAVRSLRTTRGPAHRQGAGDTPHTEAWQLAEYGRK